MYRYLELGQEISQFNVLRSFMHMNNMPNEIINYIFLLVGKNGFYVFDINFFTYSLVPIHLDSVRDFKNFCHIDVYMCLDGQYDI